MPAPISRSRPGHNSTDVSPEHLALCFPIDPGEMISSVWLDKPDLHHVYEVRVHGNASMADLAMTGGRWRHRDPKHWMASAYQLQGMNDNWAPSLP